MKMQNLQLLWFSSCHSTLLYFLIFWQNLRHGRMNFIFKIKPLRWWSANSKISCWEAFRKFNILSLCISSFSVLFFSSGQYERITNSGIHLVGASIWSNKSAAEIFAFPGCYSALIGSLLPKFQDSVFVQSSRVKLQPWRRDREHFNSHLQFHYLMRKRNFSGRNY